MKKEIFTTEITEDTETEKNKKVFLRAAPLCPL